MDTRSGSSNRKKIRIETDVVLTVVVLIVVLIVVPISLVATTPILIEDTPQIKLGGTFRLYITIVFTILRRLKFFQFRGNSEKWDG